MSSEVESTKIKLRMFPYTKRINEVKIDYDSLHYISMYNDAYGITCIVCSLLELFGLDPKKCVVTDATAGVGGNTLSFGKHFKRVNAIELNEKYFEYLRNNIKVYDMKSTVSTYHGDCLDVVGSLAQDVIYIDPPWGGKDYKKHTNLRLTLSDIGIENIILKWIDKCKMVAIKLPLNYDLDHFRVTISHKTYVYELKKMFIVVVINKDITIPYV